jgi:hypothetical protein
VSATGSGRSVIAVGRRVVVAVTVAVSVVVAGGWTSRTAPHGGGQVSVLRGTVDTVNETGTAVGFRGEWVAGPRLRVAGVDGSWVVAGASWWDGQAWHEHRTPTCLGDVAVPAPVELGVIEAAPSGDAPGRAVVVWLKCLRHP